MNEEFNAQATGGAQTNFIKSPLFVIFVTIFIDLVGFGIMIPVLPYYVKSEQFRASPFAGGFARRSYFFLNRKFVVFTRADEPRFKGSG